MNVREGAPPGRTRTRRRSCFSWSEIQSSGVIFVHRSPMRSKGIASVFFSRTQLLPVSSFAAQCFGHCVVNHRMSFGWAYRPM